MIVKLNKRMKVKKMIVIFLLIKLKIKLMKLMMNLLNLDII